jgi:YHS domain-containing protein
MKITINDQRKIFAIQEEFNIMFPYLKLEFFSKSHKLGGTSGDKLVKHNSKTLGECRTIHNKGKITITPNMTVVDLEERFKDVYGLGVQIFRKSGKVWLETTVTDGWTLEEQNIQGKTLSINLMLTVLVTLLILMTSACSIFKNSLPQYEIDPVCNMKVDKSEAYTWKYKGVEYYFDNINCKETFKMNPENILKKNNCEPKNKN